MSEPKETTESLCECGCGRPPFACVADDFDAEDEDDREADCGRWINGRLTSSCSKAGSEWCDWECPLSR